MGMEWVEDGAMADGNVDGEDAASKRAEGEAM
jgi:hypothetical protein